jgi:hypothetical protein
MAQLFIVPSIYQGSSNQGQAYFVLPDLFCSKCSSPIENGARFCAEFGTTLQQAT